MIARLRLLPLFAALPAFAQTVTATAQVRVDGNLETVRKINNRWWTQDNRELTPPKNGSGGLWILGTPKGHNFDFHHHRPVNLAKVEQLHLLMSKDTVEKIIGEPNFSAGRESFGSIMWIFYAADGTSVMLRFTQDDELSEGHYNKSDWGITPHPVESIERDLGGRSSFEYFSDRSWWKRDPKGYAKFHPNAGAMPTPATYANGSVAQASTSRAAVASGATTTSTPEPPKHRISSELAASVKNGMTRAEVIDLLGQPTGGMHIMGETEMETMTYALEPSGEFSVQLENGKVTRAQ